MKIDNLMYVVLKVSLGYRVTSRSLPLWARYTLAARTDSERRGDSYFVQRQGNGLDGPRFEFRQDLGPTHPPVGTSVLSDG